ncbi:hypothetical protein M885DRAFT_270004 [Pelagophyceae sp. CCMP2097]|nr:hypothetical protein M885DRAFT_270004 [Pelagophyceae sp. CCMP2097]
MALDAAQLAAENAALRAEVAELRERGAFLEAFYADHATAETPGDSDAEARAAAIEAAEVYVVRLRDLARRGSASDAALALGPNVSLEYTLDSPMFRKSSEAFERTVDGLGDVLRELAKRCRAWAKLQLEADAAAKLVSAFLTSRKHGRALFSGAHASLGSLSERMILFAQDFRAAAERRSAFARCVEASVCDGLIKFCENELGDVKSFSTEVWRLGDVFEGKLCDVLRYADAESLQKNGAATEQLQDARTRFETARFALVRYLNGVDAKKKLALSEALHAASQGLAAESCAFRSDLRLTQRALDVERERAVLDESLWDAVLQRLEAELSGELPPPGAPAGARAETDLTPMPGSREKGAPPWSISLTTEVGRSSVGETSLGSPSARLDGRRGATSSRVQTAPRPS